MSDQSKTPQIDAGTVVATLHRPPAWQVLHDMAAFLEMSFQTPIVVQPSEHDDGVYTFVAVRTATSTEIPSGVERTAPGASK